MSENEVLDEQAILRQLNEWSSQSPRSAELIAAWSQRHLTRRRTNESFTRIAETGRYVAKVPIPKHTREVVIEPIGILDLLTKGEDKFSHSFAAPMSGPRTSVFNVVLLGADGSVLEEHEATATIEPGDGTVDRSLALEGSAEAKALREETRMSIRVGQGHYLYSKKAVAEALASMAANL